ncbi:MAG: SDR family oxidoreductase [Candidatus Zixiibacteriota bacterium]
MRSLKNLVVVVTGASQGIGAAIARHFALEGTRLALIARNREKLEMVANDLPLPQKEILVLPTDMRNASAVRIAVQSVRENFSGIDIFINNAGVGINKPVVELSEEEFDTIFETNVKAVFHTFRELIPLFQKQGGGQIINISSGAARIGAPGLAAYAASKAALNILSESVAGEVRNDNIKISVLSPASTETRLMSNMSEASRSPSKAALKLTVDEVAEAVIFLARQNSNAWTSMADIRPLLIKR